MNFAGDYKLATVKQLKADRSGFEQVPVTELDMSSEAAQSMAYMLQSILTITEEGEMITHMPLPEGAPADEIAQAEAAGRIWNGDYLLDRKAVKFEGGNVYMNDSSKFLTGEEWVKLNTDNEGELNMITMSYQRV